MSSRRCFAIQRLMNAMRLAHAGCGVIGDVPSSPTRRSSDLVAESAKRSSAYPAEFLRVRGKRARTNSRAAWSRCQRARSEEHTSELQSHSDFVCRLLLEKKN